jgi:hypothetical protein
VLSQLVAVDGYWSPVILSCVAHDGWGEWQLDRNCLVCSLGVV